MEEIQRLQDALSKAERELQDKEKQIDILIKSERALKLTQERDKILAAELQEKLHAVQMELNRLSFVEVTYAKDIQRPMYKLSHVPGKIGHALSKPFAKKKQEESTVQAEKPINLEEAKGKLDILAKALLYDILPVPQFDSVKVSIVIPAYNQFDYTYNCVKSIVENSGDIPYEIIVADDCSTDVTAIVENIIPHCVHVKTDENVRFLLNCNHAAKHARGKYILFLNNDTEVSKNWLAPLVGLIESDEKIGMVGSKLVYPDGRLQEAGGILWKDGTAWNFGNGLDAEASEFNYVKEVDYISGAAIMIRRNLWEEIGGFDERYVPAYYEDTDLAFEVRKHGYKVMYQPLSKVVHFEGVSNGTDTSEGLKSYQIENGKKFFEKWKDVLEKDHYPEGENIIYSRDRSRYKKHILVIDQYVPNYDKDAGGRCTYMYLKLFQKLGMQVTFIGDDFLRPQPYTDELGQLQIEVLYGYYYCENQEKWLKANLPYFDYVYLQRPHIADKYIRLVKENTDAKIFYFAHDLHHIREMREYEITGDEEHKIAAEKWKDMELNLFEKADVGHVVGSYEQNLMQQYFPDKLIRNIPLYIYENILTDIDKDFSKRKDIMYVGGFKHHPNEDAVLWFAREVFPKVLKKIPEMRWHVLGSNPTEEVQKLPKENKNIIIEGYVSDERLAEFYRSCKLAVVPLRYGAGVKGKVVEAGYYQTPLVTTTIGAEGISTEEESMVIVDDPDEMAQVIIKLYKDDEELRRMSDCCIQFIEKHFSLKNAEDVIKRDL